MNRHERRIEDRRFRLLENTQFTALTALRRIVKMKCTDDTIALASAFEDIVLNAVRSMNHIYCQQVEELAYKQEKSGSSLQEFMKQLQELDKPNQKMCEELIYKVVVENNGHL